MLQVWWPRSSCQVCYLHNHDETMLTSATETALLPVVLRVATVVVAFHEVAATKEVAVPAPELVANHAT